METKKIAYSVSEETSRWIDLINRFDRVYDDANEVIHELYVNPENLSDEIYDVAEVKGTKEFLVAFKMAQEAGDLAANQINKSFQDEDIEREMYDKMSEFQDEILKLMMLQVEDNLVSLEVTEI